MPAENLLTQPELGSNTNDEWTDEELQDLAARFHVSREVVLRRLLALGRASKAFYSFKRDEVLEEYEEMARSGGGGFATPHKVAMGRAGPLNFD